MIREWDRAPDFTAPMARPENAGGRGEYTGDDVEAFTLSDRLVYGPAVLAFFPGVFSRTCTRELCDLRDWWDDLGGLDAGVYNVGRNRSPGRPHHACGRSGDDVRPTLYGVSADVPWSQLAFIDEHDLSFPLLSGFNNDVVADYGVRRREGLMTGIAERAVFVIDEEQTVIYRWAADEPGILPDTGEIEEAVVTARS